MFIVCGLIGIFQVNRWLVLIAGGGDGGGGADSETVIAIFWPAAQCPAIPQKK